ncbi:MAG: hypothetical protein ACI8RO_001651 [Flavobacteriales bacterium]|jgi:hypothetical protein
MDIDLVEVGSAYKKIPESISGAAATNVAKTMAITKKQRLKAADIPS